MPPLSGHLPETALGSFCVVNGVYTDFAPKTRKMPKEQERRLVVSLLSLISIDR